MFLTHRILSVHWLNTTMGVFMGWRVGLLCKLSNDGEPFRMEGIGRNVSASWKLFLWHLEQNKSILSRSKGTWKPCWVTDQITREVQHLFSLDRARCSICVSRLNKVQHLVPNFLHICIQCSLVRSFWHVIQLQPSITSMTELAGLQPPPNLPRKHFQFFFYLLCFWGLWNHRYDVVHVPWDAMFAEEISDEMLRGRHPLSRTS